MKMNKTGEEILAVKILPEESVIRVESGTNLLEALVSAGIRINARCGGAGACGKCKVVIKDGTVEELSDEKSRLTAEDKEKGIRLACRSIVREDIIVEVPFESRVRKLAMGEKDTVEGRKRIPPCEKVDYFSHGTHDAPVRKFYIELAEPSLQDNSGDLTRLFGALHREHGIDVREIDLPVLRILPGILREAEWKVTASILCEGTNCEKGAENCSIKNCSNLSIVRVEPGDTTASQFALAVDVGTTSIHVQIVDVVNRKPVCKSAEYNGQTAFGEDVISRIVYSLKDGHLEQLQRAAARTINELLKELLGEAGLTASDISFITAAGNTTMTQLLAGINSKHLREAPYVPTVNALPWLKAEDIGIDVEPNTPVYLFPGVASYVGGDIVSGIMGFGLARMDELTLYLDLGTNGEVVVGNKEWMMTASCSAGPAFEGGGLTCGMRATLGAVQDFFMDPDTKEPVVITIGNKKPIGVCGSGVITILAELLRFGILQQNGKLNPDTGSDRVREGESGLEYVLVWKEKSGSGEDIIITEADLDNILRAKGAVYAGCASLIKQVGLTFDMLQKVVLTGSFGNYVDIRSAITIGLLPDLPLDVYCFIPNGSLLGARLAAFSCALTGEAEQIAKSMTNIELSEDSTFMDGYMAAMFLPHTDTSLFPTVSAELEKLKEGYKS